MINLFRAIVFSTLFFVSGQPHAQQSSSNLSTDLKLDDEQTTQTLVFRAPQDGPLPELVQSILEEAYAELNIKLRYESFPRLRGEQLASEGIIAGELGRILDYLSNSPISFVSIFRSMSFPCFLSPTLHSVVSVRPIS